MLYLFIGALLVIGAKSQCVQSVCDASGTVCVDYTVGGITTQTCGCDQASDCDETIIKAAYSTIGDISVDCYDAGLATSGIATGFKTCLPQLCPNGDECDSGIDCTGGYCITADIDTNTCSDSVCAATGTVCVDYDVGGVTTQTCGCDSSTDCDDTIIKAAYSTIGDISVDCYDAGLATAGIATGYKTCLPQLCPNGDECDSGVDCTGGYCVTVDVSSDCSPTCATDETCVLGTCYSNNAGTCSPECATDEVCYASTCYDSAGTGDCGDSCTSTQICVVGTCYDLSSGTPAPVTPAPVTPAPVTPAPVDPETTEAPQGTSAGSQLTIFIGMAIMSIAALFN